MSVQNSLKRAHYSSVSISLVVNALLVAALLTFITFQEQSQRETSTVMVIDPSEQELIEEIEEEIVPEEVVEPEEIMDDLTLDMDMQLNTEFEPETEVVETTATEVSALTDLMSDVSSPVVMTGMMVGRTPSSRAAAIKRYGQGVGGVAEASVLKALEWLRDNQNENGSWNQNGLSGGKHNVGYAGLGLLTFLAHGETPASADFGPTVAKAIRYLVENQNANGSWGKLSGGHESYGHAIATYALAEAYTMTENPLLLQPLQKAITYLMDGQQPTGGFDYNYKKENRNDLSVAAWNVQAMKAAKISGVAGDRIHQALQLGMDGMLLGSNANEDGRSFSYLANNPKGRQRIVSAAGGLCLFLSGRGSSVEARESITFLKNNYVENAFLPTWNGENGNTHGGMINEWYYAVQAIFQDSPDGANFKKYYPAMVKALVANQASDGHWLCYSEKGAKQGKTYNTTLGALGLMVTYRYLPTTQADNINAVSPATSAPAAQESEEDIGFEI